MRILTAALLGGLAWTLVEYLLHRLVGHGPRRRPPTSVLRRLTPAGFLGAFNDEHLRHHADARYFAPTSQKATAAVLAFVASAGIGVGVAPVDVALAWAVGFVGVYAAYEVLHRRIHTHPPRGPYGRWLRRNHLAHHFRTPRMNYGVTSPLWDLVAGTAAALPAGEPLRVPRQLAPPWLTDASGRDYVVVDRAG